MAKYDVIIVGGGHNGLVVACYLAKGGLKTLVLERREVSVCVTPPGFDSDLIVRADLALFYRVWLGYIEYDAALRCGSVVVDGPPALARQLPRWFMWSPMARFIRERGHASTTPSGVFESVDHPAV